MTQNQTQAPQAPAVTTDAQLRIQIKKALKAVPTTKWTVAVKTLRSQGCNASAVRIVAMLRREFAFPAGRSRAQIAANAKARQLAAVKEEAKKAAAAAK